MLPAAAAVLRQPPIPNPLAAPPRPLRSHCRRAESLLPDGVKRFLGGTTTAPSPRSPAGSRFVVNGILPVDPWAPGGGIDSQSIASQLFAFSLFPYLGFLYFITRSKSAPKLTLFGFYFLLVFVGATIPAGIYAKLKYGTSLSNVDWLHGGAESLLTLTNMFIVLGLREALRKKEAKKKAAEVVPELKEKNRSSA